MADTKNATLPTEKVDLQGVMDDLQALPDTDKMKIKYIIQGAALVADKPAEEKHAG